ncbi:MAG: hypothetical protein BECKG1743E_GA0114224_103411, partial [Candidatus Kentron sp. G]
MDLFIVTSFEIREGHRPTIRHGCRMALMVALNWSVECVKEE